MVQQTTDEQMPGDESFQSPEMLDVQRKIRMMVVSSILIMGLGIFSILGVIIYKSVANNESAGNGQAVTTSVGNQLKAGESIRSMIVENGTIYLLVDGQEMTSLMLVDKKTGAVTRRIEFIPQGQ
ncbi:hypothetical protein [uncultured Cohaesibacter sp.]|uniref:hypothetical protein n=1 Tax=uncultured Cohaesibacter sp. TaxID=1002546 RepID=UPI0029C85216|nr:hypothetical protein [uncultured Cohaesibacter sp.]